MMTGNRIIAGISFLKLFFNAAQHLSSFTTNKNFAGDLQRSKRREHLIQIQLPGIWVCGRAIGAG